MQVIQSPSRAANTPKFNKKAIALAIPLLMSAHAAQAVEFELGDVEGSFTSSWSVGASWRASEANPELIARTNGGLMPSGTTDDGNQNFRKGSTFSKIFKGVHDLELKYENFGLFTRGKYWYDFKLKDEKFAHGHSANGYADDAKLNDDNFSDFAKFSGVELLDAFIYGEFELGDVIADVRLGRQVVSWGESTFIQGGINSINPVDVSAFRRPGAEIKEGLLPVNMVYTNLGLTDNASLELFYQLDWEKTEIDACGTYFSTNDFAADGCNYVTVIKSDKDAFAPVNPLNPAAGGGFYADRDPDIEPKDDGQYGLALRWYSDELDTEFGFYHMNYHSRLPFINALRSNTVSLNPAAPAGAIPVFIPGRDAINPGYFLVFPEDIKMYGVSFASNVGSVALSGELSYRENLPVQINGADILNPLLTERDVSPFYKRVAATENGGVIQGWDEYEAYQAQITALQFFDRVLGASRLTLIGEVGVTHLPNLVGLDEQRYGRNSGFGLSAYDAIGGVAGCEAAVNPSLPSACQNSGYVTRTAWGYRIRGSLSYNNAFAGVNLTPKFALSHDVNGNSAGPGAQFQEGRIATSFGLDAEYLSQYTAGISYTNFSGGDWNVLRDRDFLSLTASVSF